MLDITRARDTPGFLERVERVERVERLISLIRLSAGVWMVAKSLMYLPYSNSLMASLSRVFGMPRQPFYVPSPSHWSDGRCNAPRIEPGLQPCDRVWPAVRTPCTSHSAGWYQASGVILPRLSHAHTPDNTQRSRTRDAAPVSAPVRQAVHRCRRQPRG